jgi:hypothetical protein
MPWANRFIATETFTDVTCGNGLGTNAPGLVATVSDPGSDMVVDIVVSIDGSLGETSECGRAPRILVKSTDNGGGELIRMSEAHCNDYTTANKTHFVVRDVYMGGASRSASVFVRSDTYLNSVLYSGDVVVSKSSSHHLMEQLDILNSLTGAGGNGDLASIKGTVQANYSELVNNVGTALSGIYSKTNNLPSDPAGASDIPAADISSIKNTVEGNSSELINNVGTALSSIYSKTANLPSDPAGVSDIPAADIASIKNTVEGNSSELINNVGTALTSIYSKTANLPTDPAGVSDLPDAPDNTGIAAIQAKTDQLAFSGSDVLATLDSETVKLAADGMDGLVILEPAGDPSGWSVPEKLMWLVMRFMNKHTSDNFSGIVVHKSDDTVSTSQVVTEVSGVKSVGKAQ